MSRGVEKEINDEVLVGFPSEGIPLDVLGEDVVKKKCGEKLCSPDRGD